MEFRMMKAGPFIIGKRNYFVDMTVKYCEWVHCVSDLVYI